MPEPIKTCEVCGKQLIKWDTRCLRATACDQVLCEQHLAERYALSTAQFREMMEDFFHMRPCKG